MPKVDQKTFAEKVGVTKGRISAAIRSGILKNSVTVTGKGRGGNSTYEIDLDKGIEEWNANRNVSHTPDPDNAAAGRELGKELSDKENPKNVNDFVKAKTIREKYNAAMAKIEYEERVGKLVPVEDVKREAFKRARTVRDAILNLPGRIAAEIANMNDVHTVEMYLIEQLSQALEDLGNYKPEARE